MKNLKPFHVKIICSRNHQTHRIDIINALLTSSSRSVLYHTDPRFSLFDLWLSGFALRSQIDGEKTRSLTYGAVLENMSVLG